MIQELQKCSKSWGEFRKWIKQNKRYSFLDFYNNGKTVLIFNSSDGTTGIQASDYQLIGLFIKWLDSKGVKVWAEPTFNEDWLSFRIYKNNKVGVSEFINNVFHLTRFANREQATEAGIIKSFQIIEGEKK